MVDMIFITSIASAHSPAWAVWHALLASSLWEVHLTLALQKSNWVASVTV